MKIRLHFEVFVWLIIATVWLYFSFFHGFDDDEFQHCHNAYLIWKGFVPYRDFFEHHLPLYHILLSPLFIFGEQPSTIFLFRLASLISSSIVFLLIYRYMKENYDVLTAIFSLVLLAFVPMYLLKMTEARPESIAMIFFTATIVSVFSIKSDKEKDFFSGVLSGLMVCFSLKYVFAWSGLCAAVFLQKGRKNGILFIAGSLAGISPLLIYLLIRGLAPEFIQSTLIMNVKWKYKFSPSGYLYEAFTTAGFLIACAIAGLFSRERKNSIPNLFLLSGSFLVIICIPVPYRQSYLPFLISCTFCAAPFIKDFFNLIQNKTLKFIVAIILFLCATSNCFPMIKKEVSQTNLADLKKMEKIDNISPDTPFFDGRAFMFYRMHTGYFGFMHHELLEMLNSDDYSNHVIEEIKKHDFPVIIYDYRVKQMPSRIQDFIQNNYCVFEDDIYLPGVKIDRAQFSEGKADFTIMVTGWYRITFSGSMLSVDGLSVKSGTLQFLEKGSHFAETEQFIEDLEIILVKRK